MTAEDMARLHRAAFSVPRPWSAEEIAGLLSAPLCFCLADPNGFLIGRVVAGEAEVLTLAVHPDAQRSGIGRRLLNRFLAEAKTRGAEVAFLEVAADNAAAAALYRSSGFTAAGRRNGYFTGASGPVDALIFTRLLPGMAEVIF